MALSQRIREKQGGFSENSIHKKNRGKHDDTVKTIKQKKTMKKMRDLKTFLVDKPRN